MTGYTTIDSPLGELLVVGDVEGRLRSVSFLDEAVGTALRSRIDGDRTPAVFASAERQLREYFAGERTSFELDYDTRGTPFQERVWAALAGIPYGQTISYGKLAEQLGAPRDRIRAVGAAVGANPLLILRPCHRVVGADGSLTGYAGGVHRKHDLLTLEGALQPQLI